MITSKIFPILRNRTFRRVLFASTICTGSLSDCEKVKEMEKKYFELLNDRETLKNIDEAKARRHEIKTLSDTIVALQKSCDAAQSMLLQQKQKKAAESAQKKMQDEQEKANENAPKFFNSLVELIENDDSDMQNGIMRYVVTHGDEKIIIWTSSEWESDVYRRLPDSKCEFSYFELSMMSFGRKYNHTIKKGQFANWSVYSEPFWKRSIFFIPTREQHIVLKK